MDGGINKEFAELSKEKKRLEAELAKVKERLVEIEPYLLDIWSRDGVNRITISGITLYMHSQLWAVVAEGCTKEDAIAGLKEAGLGDFVAENYNSNTLSAHFRELAKNVDLADIVIPKGVALTEKFSIRALKA